MLALQEGTVDQVGLRPGRDAIRLEFERLVQPRTGRTLNARALNLVCTQRSFAQGILWGRLLYYCMIFGAQVIHNYGHGGSGFTLFWGCAHDVFELLAANVATAEQK